MARPTLPTTLPGRLFAVLLLWFVAVVAAWGVRPLTDHVPVRCVDPEAALAADTDAGAAADRRGAEDPNADRRPRHLRDDVEAGCTEDEFSSVRASCHSPVSRDGSIRGEPPTADPGWELDRAPCSIPVRSAALLMGANTAVFVAASGALAFWWSRRRSTAGVSPDD
jgi:hypothetical protein